MADENLFAAVALTPASQSLRERLEKGGAVSLGGITPAAQPFLAALLGQLLPNRAIVAVTSGVKAQEAFHQDVETWLQTNPPLSSGAQPETTNACHPRKPCSLYYPAWETLPHEPKLPHADVISERLETLVALASRRSSGASAEPNPALVITSVAALMQCTFPPETIVARTRLLRRGDQLDPLDLIEWLEDQGYEPEAQVTQKGEMALRGGILDVYPLISPWPVRLEFFGNELDSLRHFDPITQISREPVDWVTLPPGGEIGLLKRMLAPQTPKSGQAASPESSRSPIYTDCPLSLATLADHLPERSIFLLCEPEELSEQADLYAVQIPSGDPFFLDWDGVLQSIEEKGMTLVAVREEATEPRLISGNAEERDASGEAESPLATFHGDFGAPQESQLTFSSLDAFRPLGERTPDPQIADAQRREFFHQLHRWLRQGCAVHVYCNNDGERQRFSEIWNEYGLADLQDGTSAEGNETHPTLRGSKLDTQDSPCHATPTALPIPSTTLRLTTHLGALSRGFLCESVRLVVVTDAEIFGRYKVQRPRRLKSPHAVAARSALDIDFTDLEEGDYVVHLQHGIGRYLGLKVMPAGLGRKNVASASEPAKTGQECLVIEYAAGAPDQPAPRLYVPVTEAHLVSKYVGAGKARPVMNTLGGARWAKTKAQAEEAVRDLAAELLEVQAARESQPGYAFAPDSAWQREFESAFLYEETPDQMCSILETKQDMEKPRPMDRLICGDVGYGKTEVAIRAAFKAVLDGKQVAVLVPTTILAQQHFNTFRERMADYPVRVEQLSRFCSRRAQNRIVQQLAEGSVDITIGTHRLLQRDIVFKDLGLVIIDEEQRFGVLHKERFKMLRRLVDVLTLSATPIPRTLYLALTGARDMSTIETPPQDRLPVETVVAQFDERLIRDAIQRELNRQGQVFYLHNRILDIASVASRIQALAPHARIVVGHGQMESDELEEVMARFVNGEADVLISTTIIESGIDIPNANTIIIDRADRFGLSDLYQLRGRVGRYKHQAFAYLLLPRHAALLSDVRKRISAIKQYSSLGSGFKIAMRDLEIRGAGNLLGSQQSGHITAVGFELYCQLLKQSISSLKGEKVQPRVEVQLRLDFLALHPGDEPATDASGETSKSDPETDLAKPERPRKAAGLKIRVPREVASYLSPEHEAVPDSSPPQAPRSIPKAPAFIPFRYVRESRQRIELYRKLAQATDKPSLDKLRQEIRDRFGPWPEAMELLFQVAELKILASKRGISAMETRQDKLMLTRNNDYLTLAGKFPRLTKREPVARLNEIKKLLCALSPGDDGESDGGGTAVPGSETGTKRSRR